MTLVAEMMDLPVRLSNMRTVKFFGGRR